MRETYAGPLASRSLCSGRSRRRCTPDRACGSAAALEVKAWRFAQSLDAGCSRASSPLQPGRRRGVNCPGAIQHNGRLPPSAAVARKARLVRHRCASLRALGLMAIPVMSCAPRRLRARSAGSRGVDRSPRAEHHGQCGSGCAATASNLVRRLRREHHEFNARPPRAVAALALRRAARVLSPPRACSRPSRHRTATRGFAALARNPIPL